MGGLGVATVPSTLSDGTHNSTHATACGRGYTSSLASRLQLQPPIRCWRPAALGVVFIVLHGCCVPGVVEGGDSVLESTWWRGVQGIVAAPASRWQLRLPPSRRKQPRRLLQSSSPFFFSHCSIFFSDGCVRACWEEKMGQAAAAAVPTASLSGMHCSSRYRVGGSSMAVAEGEGCPDPPSLLWLVEPASARRATMDRIHALVAGGGAGELARRCGRAEFDRCRRRDAASLCASPTSPLLPATPRALRRRRGARIRPPSTEVC
jgi:hypothetical protein